MSYSIKGKTLTADNERNLYFRVRYKTYSILPQILGKGKDRKGGEVCELVLAIANFAWYYLSFT